MILLNIIVVLAGIWFWGAVFSSPYYWTTRVDRSLAPAARRFLAFVKAMAWPVDLYNHFSSKRTDVSDTGRPGPLRSPDTGPTANPYRGGSQTVTPASDAPNLRRGSNPYRD